MLGGVEREGVRRVRQEQMKNYDLMTVKEAAKYIGLAEKTLYTKISQRQIRYLKVGRLVKFDRNALNDWLKEQTVMPMPE